MNSIISILKCKNVIKQLGYQTLLQLTLWVGPVNMGSSVDVSARGTTDNVNGLNVINVSVCSRGDIGCL